MVLAHKYQGIIIKSLFFLTYCAAASWLTYFYIYLKDGAFLSGFEIGVIAGFQQFNNIFILPVWGIWADKYGRKRMLLFAFGLSLLLLPFFWFLEGAAAFTLFIILLTLTYNPIAPLIDTIALDYGEQSKGKSSFGEIRMWGSIGWGLSALLTGMFIEGDKLQLIFPLASFLLLLTWIILFLFYKPLANKKNINELKRGIVWETLRENKVLLSFLLIIFFYSLFSAPIYLLINVYLNEIGSSNKLIGLTYLVQGASELPFFFYGSKLVKRFGAKQVFRFTMIVTAVRMIAYGLNNDPIAAVGLGVLHGISIGLFFVSIVAFVHSLIPAYLRSTGQSLIHTFYAVGVAFGNILSGVLFDYFSMRTAMIVNGIGILLLILIVFMKGKNSILPASQN